MVLFAYVGHEELLVFKSRQLQVPFSTFKSQLQETEDCWIINIRFKFVILERSQPNRIMMRNVLLEEIRPVSRADPHLNFLISLIK